MKLEDLPTISNDLMNLPVVGIPQEENVYDPALPGMEAPMYRGISEFIKQTPVLKDVAAGTKNLSEALSRGAQRTQFNIADLLNMGKMERPEELNKHAEGLLGGVETGAEFLSPIGGAGMAAGGLPLLKAMAPATDIATRGVLNVAGKVTAPIIKPVKSLFEKIAQPVIESDAAKAATKVINETIQEFNKKIQELGYFKKTRVAELKQNLLGRATNLTNEVAEEVGNAAVKSRQALSKGYDDLKINYGDTEVANPNKLVDTIKSVIDNKTLEELSDTSSEKLVKGLYAAITQKELTPAEKIIYDFASDAGGIEFIKKASASDPAAKTLLDKLTNKDVGPYTVNQILSMKKYIDDIQKGLTVEGKFYLKDRLIPGLAEVDNVIDNMLSKATDGTSDALTDAYRKVSEITKRFGKYTPANIRTEKAARSLQTLFTKTPEKVSQAIKKGEDIYAYGNKAAIDVLDQISALREAGTTLGNKSLIDSANGLEKNIMSGIDNLLEHGSKMKGTVIDDTVNLYKDKIFKLQNKQQEISKQIVYDVRNLLPLYISAGVIMATPIPDNVKKTINFLVYGATITKWAPSSADLMLKFSTEASKRLAQALTSKQFQSIQPLLLKIGASINSNLQE